MNYDSKLKCASGIYFLVGMSLQTDFGNFEICMAKHGLLHMIAVGY